MIAPAWPLDRSIAVNPHWSRVGMPVPRWRPGWLVLGDIQVFPAARHGSWPGAGPHHRADLQQARQLPAAQAAGPPDAGPLPTRVAAGAAVAHLPLLIDLLDTDPARQARLSWRQAVTHQVSQTCAAYFDHHQADWQARAAGRGLYDFWRDTLRTTMASAC